jgi:membrane protein YdbS with pleckstrin-like domain
MAQMSEEQYEALKKRVKQYRHIFEWLVTIFLFAGIITAVLNVSFGGLTPVFWFLLAFWLVLVIICMEVTMIRAFLELKK